MHKIMVVIPARNEEQVIPNLIKSIRETVYPDSLLNVVVIADNCTDQTAAVAKNLDVEVLQRHDLSLQTKSCALQWAFYSQGLLDRDCDAVTILDADNIVDPNFFIYTENCLQKGYRIIQGQRLASNAENSVVSAVMSIIYSFENRLWYLPHANLDRSSLMLGTGATIDRDCLRKIGWSTKTLVEDDEFSIRAVLAGERIHYCDEAIVKIELPVKIKALWRQLRRWFSGQIECARIYLPAITRKVLKDRGGPATLLLITLLLPITCAIGLIQFILAPATAYLILGSALPLARILLISLGFLLVGAASSIVILLLDGRLHLKLWKGILFFPCLNLFFGVVYIYSFLFPKKKWDLISHHHIIKIEPKE